MLLRQLHSHHQCMQGNFFQKPQTHRQSFALAMDAAFHIIKRRAHTHQCRRVFDALALSCFKIKMNNNPNTISSKNDTTNNTSAAAASLALLLKQDVLLTQHELHISQKSQQAAFSYAAALLDMMMTPNLSNNKQPKHLPRSNAN